ncbi:MAG: GNAT family N-acetyltransferase [Acidimicrobiia bacterium]|nr:GNAT family N-acetyltransferase [Acidimicrobiia bacterium]
MASTTWVTATSSDWHEVLPLVEHDTYHLPEYVSICGRLEAAESTAFSWSDDRGGRFFLPLLFREIPGTSEVDATSPYGYPGPAVSPGGLGHDQWLAACAALRSALEERGARSCFVRLNPLLPADLEAMATVGAVVHHGSTVVMDLRRTDEEILAGIRKNHRRDIKRSNGEGRVATVDEAWAHLPQFVHVYHETMRRVGADERYSFSQEYFEELRKDLDEHVHLIVVHAGDELTAGAVLFETSGIVQYHLGGTLDRFLAQQPAKLIFDLAWRWSKQRGDAALHLGGGVGAAADALLRFKQGFSKEERSFHTWRIVPSREAYESLVRRQGVDLRSGDDEVFPAYRSLG